MNPNTRLDDYLQMIIVNGKRNLIPDTIKRMHQQNWRIRYHMNLPEEYTLEVSYNCALSQKLLVTPVRSNKCQKLNCVFSLASLVSIFTDFLEEPSKDIKCPNCYQAYIHPENFELCLDTCEIIDIVDREYPDITREDDGKIFVSSQGKWSIKLGDSNDLIPIGRVEQMQQMNLVNYSIKKAFTTEAIESQKSVIRFFQDISTRMTAINPADSLQVKFPDGMQSQLESELIPYFQLSQTSSRKLFESNYTYTLLRKSKPNQQEVILTEIFLYFPCLDRYFARILVLGEQEEIFQYRLNSATAKGFNPDIMMHCVYMIGGSVTDKGKSYPVKDFYEVMLFHQTPINMSNNLLVNRLPDLPRAIASAYSVVQNDRLFIFGGVTQTDFNREVFMYDFQEKQWKIVAELPAQRFQFSFCMHGNCVYLIGGIQLVSEKQIMSRRLDVFDLDKLRFNAYPEFFDALSDRQIHGGRKYGFRYMNKRSLCIYKPNNNQIISFGGDWQSLEMKKPEKEVTDSTKVTSVTEICLDTGIMCNLDINIKYFLLSKFIQDFQTVNFNDKYYFLLSNSENQKKFKVVYDETKYDKIKIEQVDDQVFN